MDIAGRLKDAGFDIDRRLIQLEQPLKNLGEFTVPVRLRTDVLALLKVTVAAEE
jgi:large subunit ribosomal protein L9